MWPLLPLWRGLPNETPRPRQTRPQDAAPGPPSRRPARPPRRGPRSGRPSPSGGCAPTGGRSPVSGSCWWPVWARSASGSRSPERPASSWPSSPGRPSVSAPSWCRSWRPPSASPCSATVKARSAAWPPAAAWPPLGWTGLLYLLRPASDVGHGLDGWRRAGGVLGAAVGNPLRSLAGPWGAGLILAALAFVGLLILLRLSFDQVWRGLRRAARGGLARRGRRAAPPDDTVRPRPRGRSRTSWPPTGIPGNFPASPEQRRRRAGIDHVDEELAAGTGPGETTARSGGRRGRPHGGPDRRPDRRTPPDARRRG